MGNFPSGDENDFVVLREGDKEYYRYTRVRCRTCGTIYRKGYGGVSNVLYCECIE
jgi:hypothetical protein